jgi:hypothetical protein
MVSEIVHLQESIVAFNALCIEVTRNSSQYSDHILKLIPLVSHCTSILATGLLWFV